MLETKVIRKTTLPLPSHWYMSDADLRKLSPPTGNPEIPAEDRHLSPLERKRNFKFKLIAPLVEIAEKTAPIKLPDLSCLDALVQARAREAGVSAGQVFDALHRYYAFGCVRNALLPNNTGRSGAPGKKRRAKNGVKLGRKNAAVKAGRTDQAGIILTDQDVENMQDGYSAFVRPGTTIRDAFLSMSAVYYSNGYTQKHGYWAVDLLPANERPTESDFRYHGPAGKDQYAAARRLMGEGQWAKNFRPLVGTPATASQWSVKWLRWMPLRSMSTKWHVGVRYNPSEWGGDFLYAMHGWVCTWVGMSPSTACAPTTPNWPFSALPRTSQRRCSIMAWTFQRTTFPSLFFRGTFATTANFAARMVCPPSSMSCHRASNSSPAAVPTAIVPLNQDTIPAIVVLTTK